MPPHHAPDRGDIVWLEFTPHAGHEQAGRRPAITISPRSYNAASGLALFCPVTTKPHGYPFEVALPDKSPVSGVVLADQVKSLDWKARYCKVAGHVDPATLAELQAKIRVLVD